jgi:hypothetical protein
LLRTNAGIGDHEENPTVLERFGIEIASNRYGYEDKRVPK